MENTITNQPADHWQPAQLGIFTSAHPGKFETALTGIELGRSGRVLYVTLDPGADKDEVSDRFDMIAEQVGRAPDTWSIEIVDAPFYLDDPQSVDEFLAVNTGPYVLVVLDSLFFCCHDVMQPSVARAAIEGVSTIIRQTGAAVFVVHHETKAGELFGSILIQVGHSSLIHVTKPAPESRTVKVKVESLKNATLLGRPLVYTMVPGTCYLAPVGENVPVLAAPKPAVAEPSALQASMLALLPAVGARLADWRQLCTNLIGDGDPSTRSKRWRRAVKAMERAGRIVVKQGRAKHTT